MNKNVICRTCLIKQDLSNCKQLIPQETYNNILVLSIVKLCIPELDFNIYAHSAICLGCLRNLTEFYNFKVMCLKNNLQYSKLLESKHFDEEPSQKTDRSTVAPDVYNNTTSKADINQNETLENINSPQTPKKKTFTFYRNKFVNNDCFGCRNRILDVKYHSKVHEGFYDCFNCGKRFTSIADIRKHIYIHTLSYKCDICGKHWRGKYALDIHLRSHTKQKPFECPVCNKKFVQSYSLHQHLAVHQEQNDNNRNRCPVCDKVLSTKYNLKIHMTTHNTQSKPRCSKCNKWFYTEAAVIKHSATCLIKQEDSTMFVQPEFVKTEIKDSIKEEPEDDIFLEIPTPVNTENLKSEPLEKNMSSTYKE